MSTQRIASAIERVCATLQRKPQAGLHDDSAATARWTGGLRTQIHSDSGRTVSTDMPTELGGDDSAMTPGWLWRAGLASCAVTRIAMVAASEGIELELLEARTTSRSDTRGMLGMRESDGSPVPAQPLAVALQVRIAAQGVPAQRLRELVESSAGCSPVSCVVQHALALTLHVEVTA